MAIDTESVKWNTGTNPLTISLASGLPIRAIWFPVPPSATTFTFVDHNTGNPFPYVMSSSGQAEIVAVPFLEAANVAPVRITKIDITASPGLSSSQYVFYSSVPWNPFKQGGAGGGSVAHVAVRIRLTDSDFSPSGTGAAAQSVVVVPYDPVTDASVVWTVTELMVRAETAGSSNTVGRFEYSSGGSAFSSLGDIDPAGLTLGSGSHGAVLNSGFAVTTLNSGQLVRFNVTTLGSGIAGISSYIALSQ